MNKSLVFRPPYGGFASALRRDVEQLGLPVVLCIGSDRLTGDCLGPIVGDDLVSRYNVPCYVYGTLARPVTALNLERTNRFIRTRHPEAPLVVIDASLGDPKDVGNLRITYGGIRPGSASGKSFRPCGDLSITGVVNGLPCESLSSTRLGFVRDLAGVISAALAASIFAAQVRLAEPNLPTFAS